MSISEMEHFCEENNLALSNFGHMRKLFYLNFLEVVIWRLLTIGSIDSQAGYLCKFF